MASGHAVHQKPLQRACTPHATITLRLVCWLCRLAVGLDVYQKPLQRNCTSHATSAVKHAPLALLVLCGMADDLVVHQGPDKATAAATAACSAGASSPSPAWTTSLIPLIPRDVLSTGALIPRAVVSRPADAH